jgi:hypothetical protein
MRRQDQEERGAKRAELDGCHRWACLGWLLGWLLLLALLATLLAALLNYDEDGPPGQALRTPSYTVVYAIRVHIRTSTSAPRSEHINGWPSIHRYALRVLTICYFY